MTGKSLIKIVQQLLLTCCMLKKKQIYILPIFQNNLNHEKKIILLMVPKGEGWPYLAVKLLSALLKGIKSKHKMIFCCLNCLHSFRT